VWARIEGLLDVACLHRGDGQLVHRWTRRPATAGSSSEAALFALYASAQDVLRSSGAEPEPTWVSVEAEHGRVLLGAAGGLIGAFTFEARIPFGMVRAQVRQVLDRWHASGTPHPVSRSTGSNPPATITSEESSELVQRVQRLVDAVRRRAPEPDAALAHLARVAGVPVIDLANPERLPPATLETILRAVPRSS
jgi:hypothetical protein